MIEWASRASRSSFVSSDPPSPAVMIFEDWWLNEPKSPMHPAPCVVPALAVSVRAVFDDGE